MSKLQTASGSTLGKSIAETISVDKDELRAIVKEYVQKKFAVLAESKKAALIVREGKVTESGSILGKGAAPQAEAMGGGVTGAMAPMTENGDSPELDKGKSVFGKKPRAKTPGNSSAALEFSESKRKP